MVASCPTVKELVVAADVTFKEAASIEVAEASSIVVIPCRLEAVDTSSVLAVTSAAFRVPLMVAPLSAFNSSLVTSSLSTVASLAAKTPVAFTVSPVTTSAWAVLDTISVALIFLALTDVFVVMAPFVVIVSPSMFLAVSFVETSAVSALIIRDFRV